MSRLITAVTAVVMLLLSTTLLVAQADPLTPEERQWLVDHPNIIFAPAPNYPPVEFFDEEGVYQGITADFVAHIRESLGVELKVVQLPDWRSVVEETRKGKVDMWGAAAKTKERMKYMNFTRPYIRLPAVIIVQKKITEPLTMNELEGLRVVAIEGYATQKYIEEVYPELDLIKVPDIESGLSMVSFGIADAIIATNASAIYYIEKNGFTNLRVAGNSGFEWKLRFAARKEHPELLSILQKGLDSISEEKKREIYRRWISLKAPSWRPNGEFFFISGLVVALLLSIGILIWNRTLQHQVKVKTRALEAELGARRVLEGELRRLATTDELTGVMNRRSLLREVEKEFERCRRYSSPMSMALFDADHFKKINDTYGHEAGDIVLKELAECCRQTLRSQDMIGRIGGEEFVVVLVETDARVAASIMERLRLVISDTPVALPDGREVQLTVSIGLSSLDHSVESVDVLYRRCDEAMYKAKAGGRNRLVVR